MQVDIYKDYEALSQHAEDIILSVVSANPAAVLCLATGDTPRLTYELVAAKAKKEPVDFTRCTFIALDEWIGVPPVKEGSCRFFLTKQLFEPLDIKPSQVHLFDSMSANPEAECLEMDKAIAAAGG
ncbi:MAG: 6-phosphogluconolactonase, partial [Ferruginibacter sp.]